MVSLNEATLKKEQDADKKLDDEDKEEDKPKDGEDPPIFADNDYNKEVVHITTDYFDLVKDLKTAKK
ncbi:MAG: hypothetical protein KDA84_27625, partial [Planctomycetaceae bacterium]|nr:hypothetical protein [Planctomycetaceae bacterium]